MTSNAILEKIKEPHYTIEAHDEIVRLGSSVIPDLIDLFDYKHVADCPIFQNYVVESRSSFEFVHNNIIGRACSTIENIGYRIASTGLGSSDSELYQTAKLAVDHVQTLLDHSDRDVRVKARRCLRSSCFSNFIRMDKRGDLMAKLKK